MPDKRKIILFLILTALLHLMYYGFRTGFTSVLVDDLGIPPKDAFHFFTWSANLTYFGMGLGGLAAYFLKPARLVGSAFLAVAIGLLLYQFKIGGIDLGLIIVSLGWGTLFTSLLVYFCNLLRNSHQLFQGTLFLVHVLIINSQQPFATWVGYNFRTYFPWGALVLAALLGILCLFLGNYINTHETEPTSSVQPRKFPFWIAVIIVLGTYFWSFYSLATGIFYNQAAPHIKIPPGWFNNETLLIALVDALLLGIVGLFYLLRPRPVSRIIIPICTISFVCLGLSQGTYLFDTAFADPPSFNLVISGIRTMVFAIADAALFVGLTMWLMRKAPQRFFPVVLGVHLWMSNWIPKLFDPLCEKLPPATTIAIMTGSTILIAVGLIIAFSKGTDLDDTEPS